MKWDDLQYNKNITNTLLMHFRSFLATLAPYYQAAKNMEAIAECKQLLGYINHVEAISDIHGIDLWHMYISKYACLYSRLQESLYTQLAF